MLDPSWCWASTGSCLVKNKHLISQGANVFRELVKSSHGKNNTFRIFSLKELQKATNNFSGDSIWNDDRAGRYTYGGIIEDTHVAVKIGICLNEVVCPSLIKHRNVVKLLGCCLETFFPIAVHELPPSNETLEEYLDNTPVEVLWTDRLRIAMEVADALSYLHSELHITHGGLRDSRAVLLDEFHSAKLGAFDNARIQKGQNQAESSDRFLFTNKRRKRDDVYDFGTILLNLLCIQTHDRSKFEIGKEKVEILKYFKLNVSEREMPQIEAYIDLMLRCRDREDELIMKEVARELRRIRSM